MNLTPSQKGSFLAGVGLWVLIWASVWKADDIAQAMRIERWFNSARCLRWIDRHKSTSLLGTELVNYGTHGLDPLGVSFSLGGTLVNVLFIYLLLPCLEKLLRQRGTANATLPKENPRPHLVSLPAHSNLSGQEEWLRVTQKGSATMRMSIGVPGISIYFDHRQIKPFIKDHSKKTKELFNERVVPAVLRGTCRALEVVANNTADAHDFLISKTKPKQSA